MFRLLHVEKSPPVYDRRAAGPDAGKCAGVDLEIGQTGNGTLTNGRGSIGSLPCLLAQMTAGGAVVPPSFRAAHAVELKLARRVGTVLSMVVPFEFSVC